MPSFRVNLLHGSLETRRANWFLHCFFFFISYTAPGSLELFSQMGQINRALCAYLERGEGQENWWIRGWGGVAGEGEWREAGGRRGGKVVGVIPLLEPVALTLTVAWKPNQSVSIHAESGFMWADSGTRLYDGAPVSQLLLTLLPALFVNNDFHWFQTHCLLFIVCRGPLFICILMILDADQ